MKRFLFVLALFFTSLLAGTGFSANAQKTIGRDDPFPRLSLDDQMAQSDLDYLGITRSKYFFSFFTSSGFSTCDIDADIVVIEFLNIHCVSCQKQVKLLNRLYSDIADNPSLRGRVKILGVAAGNFMGEIKRFKKSRSIPYPIMPDPDFAAYEAIGNPGGTPITYLIRKQNDALTVLSVHMGLMQSADVLLGKVSAYIKHAGSIEDEKNGPAKDARGRSLKLFELDLPEAALQDLVKKSMLGNPLPGRSAKIASLEKIQLPEAGSVFRGEKITGGRKLILFSKLISRKPVCDVCHEVHFIITFNSMGTITNFSPVHLTKSYNNNWSKDDKTFLLSRLLGKSLKHKLAFDPAVDSVSTATMTCALIFNSINHLNETYRALAGAGLIP